VIVWALAVTACANPDVQREHLEDGTFRLRCPGALTTCLSHVTAVCSDAGFDVVEARDSRSYTGPTQVERETRSSEAVIRCHSRGAPLFDDDDAPAAAKEGETKAKPSPKAAKPPKLACTPGSTQACVGVGACSGGQACLKDGSGFGPCQCAAPEPKEASSGPEAPAEASDANAGPDKAGASETQAPPQ
jgi:hypothetical protein